MAVVVSVHRLSATHLISENSKPPKLHLKFNTPRLSFHHFPQTNKHQLRCLSAKSTPSSPDPDSPQDGEEQESVGVKAALAMLRFYKREISPVLPRSCRYVPTCSEYSMEAYKKYGVLKGTVLTTWRLCRCNPLGGSGFDPPRWFGESVITPQAEEEEDSYSNEDEREI
ncbi:hypothetical protein BRARA_E03097 [Brassica rapa]|uniref:BnaA05g29120D protein n=3 Tax=Brassica TaxID=3705 RepID=A0A078I5D4_BRANA|nr:UPF0161 protein At3g09310 [Brassica napus]KAH0927618.1 hypothetical protein HID58_019874 [Brassica napus]RID64141.1 hypothetical protein BRARA_E03097 [Brassica rapa]CAF2102499.1 unnamed protein product [Brassica napus]CDY44694.1 BnaA05g29120D [Brassica napus]